MAKGGSAPARKGARFEVRVLQDQQRLGRVAYRTRQGQGTAVDIVALERCQDGHCTVKGDRVGHVYLIQCRDRSDGRVGVMGTERLSMLADSAASGATPLLAFPLNGCIEYRELGQ